MQFNKKDNNSYIKLDLYYDDSAKVNEPLNSNNLISVILRKN